MENTPGLTERTLGCVIDRTRTRAACVAGPVTVQVVCPLLVGMLAAIVDQWAPPSRLSSTLTPPVKPEPCQLMGTVSPML